ncbi:hypothetical protein [Salana multivorans]
MTSNEREPGGAESNPYLPGGQSDPWAPPVPRPGTPSPFATGTGPLPPQPRSPRDTRLRIILWTAVAVVVVTLLVAGIVLLTSLREGGGSQGGPPWC